MKMTMKGLIAGLRSDQRGLTLTEVLVAMMVMSLAAGVFLSTLASVQKSVAGVLQRTGIPSRDEIRTLIARVEELNKKVEKLHKA